MFLPCAPPALTLVTCAVVAALWDVMGALGAAGSDPCALVSAPPWSVPSSHLQFVSLPTIAMSPSALASHLAARYLLRSAVRLPPCHRYEPLGSSLPPSCPLAA
jgi:hypothetical protein